MQLSRRSHSSGRYDAYSDAEIMEMSLGKHSMPMVDKKLESALQEILRASLVFEKSAAQAGLPRDESEGCSNGSGLADSDDEMDDEELDLMTKVSQLHLAMIAVDDPNVAKDPSDHSTVAATSSFTASITFGDQGLPSPLPGGRPVLSIHCVRSSARTKRVTRAVLGVDDMLPAEFCDTRTANFQDAQSSGYRTPLDTAPPTPRGSSTTTTSRKRLQVAFMDDDETPPPLGRRNERHVSRDALERVWGHLPSKHSLAPSTPKRKPSFGYAKSPGRPAPVREADVEQDLSPGKAKGARGAKAGRMRKGGPRDGLKLPQFIAAAPGAGDVGKAPATLEVTSEGLEREKHSWNQTAVTCLERVRSAFRGSAADKLAQKNPNLGSALSVLAGLFLLVGLFQLARWGLGSGGRVSPEEMYFGVRARTKAGQRMDVTSLSLGELRHLCDEASNEQKKSLNCGKAVKAIRNFRHMVAQTAQKTNETSSAMDSVRSMAMRNATNLPMFQGINDALSVSDKEAARTLMEILADRGDSPAPEAVSEPAVEYTPVRNETGVTVAFKPNTDDATWLHKAKDKFMTAVKGGGRQLSLMQGARRERMPSMLKFRSHISHF